MFYWVFLVNLSCLVQTVSNSQHSVTMCLNMITNTQYYYVSASCVFRTKASKNSWIKRFDRTDAFPDAKRKLILTENRGSITARLVVQYSTHARHFLTSSSSVAASDMTSSPDGHSCCPTCCCLATSAVPWSCLVTCGHKPTAETNDTLHLSLTTTHDLYSRQQFSTIPRLARWHYW